MLGILRIGGSKCVQPECSVDGSFTTCLLTTDFRKLFWPFKHGIEQNNFPELLLEVNSNERDTQNEYIHNTISRDFEHNEGSRK